MINRKSILPFLFVEMLNTKIRRHYQQFLQGVFKMRTYLLWRICTTITALVMIFCAVVTAQNVKSNQFEYRGDSRVNTKTNITAAMYNVNSKVYTGTPEEIARQYLNENKTAFGISNIADAKLIQVIESPAGKHVGFLQTYNGIPIFGSETVVSINKENRVSMVVNGNTPITGISSTTAAVDKDFAVSSAIAKVQAEEKTMITQPKSELYIYKDSLDQFTLVWKINFIAQNPHGDWQVFVDANTGKVLKVENIGMRYVSGSGKVFKPDPITALQNSSLTDQNNSDYTALQNAYVTVTLSNLNDAIGGVYRLQGKYARSGGY
jgi:Zn-dependent metalloprotease